MKSTVIPGTCDKVVLPILKQHSNDFGLCMNPEFLTEINTTWTDDLKFKRDFWCKERVVVGEMDIRSGDVLQELYMDLGAPIFRVDLKTAEMCKYATNMMLLTKISYWNEIYLICKELGIDSNNVANITAMDARIGRYGTIHGLAAGGTCLMKDISAFTDAFCKYKNGMLQGYDLCPSVLNETRHINEYMAQEYGIRE
jgi:UDPglucose 6-dehydrogenase